MPDPLDLDALCKLLEGEALQRQDLDRRLSDTETTCDLRLNLLEAYNAREALTVFAERLGHRLSALELDVLRIAAGLAAHEADPNAHLRAAAQPGATTDPGRNGPPEDRAPVVPDSATA